MATCKICKKEYKNLDTSREFCPACRISNTVHKEQLIQDKHLKENKKDLLQSKLNKKLI